MAGAEHTRRLCFVGIKSRVVVPPQGQAAVLEELHETHPGCSKMKALTRSYIWWPKMDQEIENLVKSCSVCQESRPSPPTAPLHPWQWSSQPWSRLHLDFAGPYMGHMFLVIIDTCSKWLDAYIMSTITSSKTIECSERYSQLMDYCKQLSQTMVLHSQAKNSNDLWIIMVSSTQPLPHITPPVTVKLRGPCGH